MVFSSILFISIFLPFSIVIYIFISKILKLSMFWQNSCIVLLSLLFYYFGTGRRDIILLFILLISNYFFGYFINFNKSKIFLTLGILFNIGLLSTYKYPNLFGFLYSKNDMSTADAVFPLGLSFITFHCISYIVDTYKFKTDCGYGTIKNIINYSTYILFFPKLIQGPIVRFSDMKSQILNRRVCIDDIFTGLSRIVYGLFKKAVIADQLGLVSMRIFSLSGMDTITAWMGMIIFSLQIYIDFSSYSDMAIGISKIFGFTVDENFRLPYLSTSISEFWTRWHISLGNWFKHYVYIPMGGNRTGNLYFNLFTVFLITGMWHGNTKIYILWGISHGIFVMFEKTHVYHKISKFKYFKIIGWMYTSLVVSVGWLCFIIPSMTDFLQYVKTLLGIQQCDVQLGWQLFMTGKNIFLIIIAILISMVSPKFIIDTLKIKNKNTFAFTIFKSIIVVLLLLISYIFITANGYSPFIYFRY